jgi:DNA polymerase-3 subunit delta'
VSFSRVVGHPEGLAFLRAALAAGKLPHALLFSGPAGVGKRLAALETAKALLCGRGKGEACDACDACSRADRGLHPDLALIAPNEKQNVTIGDVRQLIAGVQLKPLEGPVRAALIDGADRMNEEAQNALLKTLEEPPHGAHILLIAAGEAGLLPTVLSRCQRVRFGPLSAGETREALGRAGVAAEEAELLAALAHGSPGRALELRDLEARGRVEAVAALLGRARTGEIAPLPDWSKIERREAFFDIDVLGELLRDLLVLKTAPAGRLLHAGRRAGLAEAAGRFSEEDLEAAFEAAAEARDAAEHSVNNRLVFLKLWTDVGVRFVA